MRNSSALFRTEIYSLSHSFVVSDSVMRIAVVGRAESEVKEARVATRCTNGPLLDGIPCVGVIATHSYGGTMIGIIDSAEQVDLGILTSKCYPRPPRLVYQRCADFPLLYVQLL